MNKKFQVCVGGMLLLPLAAFAGSTVNLPVNLSSTTATTAKLTGTVSSLTATSSSVTALPLLPPLAAPATAAAGSIGSAQGGGLPLPGLEGLGGSGSNPIGKPSGIRPIRLPGPSLFSPGH